MGWHIYEKLLESVANYSPFIGKLWITFLFIFRFLVIVSIGDSVYGDEQEEFVCNTLQPGCEQVCYNHFAPLSHIRFWAVQILFVGTPSVLFMVYAMHVMTTIPVEEPKKEEEKGKEGKKDSVKDKAGESTSTDSDSTENGSKTKKEPSAPRLRGSEYGTRVGNTVIIVPDEKGQLPSYAQLASGNDYYITHVDIDSNEEETLAAQHRESIRERFAIDGKRSRRMRKKKKKEEKLKKAEIVVTQDEQKIVKTPQIAVAYFVHAIARTIIEAGFLYLQYRLYNFSVPEYYICEGFPCPRVIDCFVSRPMEKTLFLIFMYVVSGISFLLNIIELYILILKYVKHACSKDKSNKRGWAATDHVVLRRGPRGQFMRPHIVNTFPDLGPFPRRHDDIGSDHDRLSVGSDRRFYR